MRSRWSGALVNVDSRLTVMPIVRIRAVRAMRYDAHLKRDDLAQRPILIVLGDIDQHGSRSSRKVLGIRCCWV